MGEDKSSEEVEEGLTHMDWAVWWLNDRFRRFGGGAQYPGMRFRDIFVYVAAQLLKRSEPAPDLTGLVDARFEPAVGDTLPDVASRLAQIRGRGPDLLKLVQTFIVRSQGRVDHLPQSERWDRLTALLERMR